MHGIKQNNICLRAKVRFEILKNLIPCRIKNVF